MRSLSWVVGLAPGPLDVSAAHAAIVQALGQHAAGADLAELTERLHVDPQPYSEDELRATGDAVTNALVSAQLGVGWTAGAGGCARLRKPLVVALHATRTRVVVTLRLADGRTATHSPTYVRCG
ncbi:MAG TPA: hypothetical protein VHZ75_00755 [Solirubrobacteraceae bacterium]|jgi:hypothetical protein|nr:hypothetical protein [Solirubrobacteraceae bacterium]